MLRGDTQRTRLRIDPALSLVPLARRTAEGLLAHHRASRLVVEVEVARRIPQDLARLGQGRPIAREHRTRSGAYGLVPLTRFSVSRHFPAGYTCTVMTGPNSSSHMSRYFGSSEVTSVGWTNQPSLSSVPPPAMILTPGCRLRLIEIALDAIEGLPVDHGAHEVPEVGHVAHPDVDDHRHHPVAHLGPQRVGDVGA